MGKIVIMISSLTSVSTDLSDEIFEPSSQTMPCLELGIIK